MVEQYRYSPTGIPFGLPRGDVDADGAVTTGGSSPPQSDEWIVDQLIPSSTSQVSADLDGDADSAGKALKRQ